MRVDQHVFASALEQAAAMRAGHYTPAELLDAYLARIRRYDEGLRAFINIDEEGSRARAEALGAELKSGRVRSRLHGTIFAVKDQMNLERLPTTGGSRAKVDLSLYSEATVVRRLEEAGAILLGTLNTHEFHNGPTRHFPFGRPRNPWNHSRSPGGSSSGSAAAVAAGLCSFSLGGDTGGSIRVPAANCGVVGLKPTWSRVSRAGVIPLLPSMDCVGPLTRTVADSEAVLELVAGFDPADKTTNNPPFEPRPQLENLRGLRLGLIDELMRPEMTSPESLSLTQAAIRELEGLGAEVVTRSIPLLAETRYLMPALVSSEAVNNHRQALQSQYGSYDQNTRVSMLVGALLPANLVRFADRLRSKLALQITDALAEVDLLVGPSSGRSAPAVAELEPFKDIADVQQRLYGVGIASGQHTRPFNFAGVPAISVPCGVDSNHLPVGLQFVGKHFDEGLMLAAAKAFEGAQSPTSLVPPSYAE